MSLSKPAYSLRSSLSHNRGLSLSKPAYSGSGLRQAQPAVDASARYHAQLSSQTAVSTGSSSPASGSLDVSSAMALDVAQPGAAAKESVEVETKMKVGFSRSATSTTK